MREVEEYQQEIEGHSVKIEDMQQEITLLKTKHVYQEVFNINIDGPIGSINGFRMGSLAKEKVRNSSKLIVLDKRTGFNYVLYYGRLSGEKWTLVLDARHCCCGKWSNSRKKQTIQSCRRTVLCPKSPCLTSGTNRTTKSILCKSLISVTISDAINANDVPYRCNEGEFSAWYLLSDSNFDIALSLLLLCLKNVSDWASRNDQVNVPHRCVIITSSSLVKYLRRTDRMEKDKIYTVIEGKEEGLSIKFRSNSYGKSINQRLITLANGFGIAREMDSCIKVHAGEFKALVTVVWKEKQNFNILAVVNTECRLV